MAPAPPTTLSAQAGYSQALVTLLRIMCYASFVIARRGGSWVGEAATAAGVDEPLPDFFPEYRD